MSIMCCENCGVPVDTDRWVDEGPHCDKDIFEKEPEEETK